MRFLRLLWLPLMVLPLLGHAERVDVRLLGQSGEHFFFNFPTSHVKDRAYIRQFVEQFCADKRRCYVSAWETGVASPARFPLDDNAVKNQLISYTKNLATGKVDLLWSCSFYPDVAKSECFSN